MNIPLQTEVHAQVELPAVRETPAPCRPLEVAAFAGSALIAGAGAAGAAIEYGIGHEVNAIVDLGITAGAIATIGIIAARAIRRFPRPHASR